MMRDREDFIGRECGCPPDYHLLLCRHYKKPRRASAMRSRKDGRVRCWWVFVHGATDFITKSPSTAESWKAANPTAGWFYPDPARVESKGRPAKGRGRAT